MSKEEKSCLSAPINWYPGHMAKTKKQIKENMSLIDIVYEVIDARIPMSSKNNDIEEIIGNKPRIIVMTKWDLCDEYKSNRWVHYYENKGYPVVKVNLLGNMNFKEIYEKTDVLLKPMMKKRMLMGLKNRRVRVLILGIPNVGKSTLINRLVKRSAANIGNKPGVTKQIQWIRINDKLELMDTPGILWPKLDDMTIAYNLASMATINDDVIDKESVARYIIEMMMKYYSTEFIKRYNLDGETDEEDILDKIGLKIGARKKSETDYDRVYNVIINDLRLGYLGKVTFDEYVE